MLQRTFYDTLIFASELEAERAGEIYKAEYIDKEAIIKDPDGKTTIIKLNYEPRFGLDVSDHAKIFEFLDSDMEKRSKEK